MTWNWQHKKWPEFQWDKSKLAKAERLFLEGAAVTIGATRHMEASDHNPLLVELLTTEAIDTSEIEGEFLDRGSVQSSIGRELGLAVDPVRAGPGERGVAKMVVDSYRSFNAPLTTKMICEWHRMVMGARNDLHDIGKYRSHLEPMLIVSGPDYARKIHFEAPPSRQVLSEMKLFLDWFEANELTNAPLARAGIAHLWFESIHPFEDGNGRIGRMIAEKALSHAFEKPVLTVLSKVLLRRKKQYYQALEKASTTLAITDWLLWFCVAVIESQRDTLMIIDFIVEKTKLLKRLEGQLNARQEKVLLRMLKAGPAGFKGGLSAQNYRQICGATTATTTRDCKDLVEKGALRREGEQKATRYYLTIKTKSVKPILLEDIL